MAEPAPTTVKRGVSFKGESGSTTLESASDARNNSFPGKEPAQRRRSSTGSPKRSEREAAELRTLANTLTRVQSRVEELTVRRRRLGVSVPWGVFQVSAIRGAH